MASFAERCKDQQMWRLALVKKYKELKTPRIPGWLEWFFDKSNILSTEIACGGSKGVFVFNKEAISIQVLETDITKRMVEWNRNNKIQKKLDIIPPEYKKHFNFYEDQFEWEGFLFSKLTLCPKGTLRNLLFGGKYDLEQKSIKELIVALNEAHRAGLIISDLKPDNIMLCDCDCLAFIDMDSAIPLPYSDGSIYSTNWWNILSKPIGYVDLEHINLLFKCSDWIAMSLVVMLHYAMRLYDPDKVLQYQNNITRWVYTDWKKRDLTYDRIRKNITKKDFEECCNNKGITPGLGDRLGPAAHAVLKSFSYNDKKLPSIIAILNLIKVSRQGDMETRVRKAVGLDDGLGDFDLKLKL